MFKKTFEQGIYIFIRKSKELVNKPLKPVKKYEEITYIENMLKKIKK